MDFSKSPRALFAKFAAAAMAVSSLAGCADSDRLAEAAQTTEQVPTIQIVCRSGGADFAYRGLLGRISGDPDHFNVTATYGGVIGPLKVRAIYRMWDGSFDMAPPVIVGPGPINTGPLYSFMLTLGREATNKFADRMANPNDDCRKAVRGHFTGMYGPMPFSIMQIPN